MLIKAEDQIWKLKDSKVDLALEKNFSEKDKEEDKIIEKLQETATMDYIRNVFVKYLIYMAKKSEKETWTLEKVLFTVLNIP